MNPPLCTVPGCGAELPDPMRPSVVTCPRCGAKSEARTQAPESERKAINDAVDMLAQSRTALAESEARAKPVDLAAARIRADVLEEYDFDAGAATIRTMAIEIEGLRAEVAAAHAAGVAEERARWEAAIVAIEAEAKTTGKAARESAETRVYERLFGHREGLLNAARMLREVLAAAAPHR